METADSGSEKKKRATKKTPYRTISLKLRLTEQEFVSMAEEAIRMGCRPKGQIWLHPPNEFAPVPNCKGISRFLRDVCFPAWVRGEAERAIKRRELEKEAEKLGLKIG
jgi:hypothetical protein